MIDDGIPNFENHPSVRDEMHTELLELGQRIDNLKEYRRNDPDLTGLQQRNIQAQLLTMYQYYAILESRITEMHNVNNISN